MLRPNRQVAAIPQPTATLESLHAVALATKELAETLGGQRGSTLNAAVTWQDLVNLGLIKPGDVPK